MSLINPAMLLGLALATIPVIVHLAFRAKPKRLIFPALQLIRDRRRHNVRRLRLRHWWLLLLRILVIGLIVVAIARPAVPPARYALTTGEWLLLAGLTAAVLGAYFGLLHYWKRQRIAEYQWRTRRSLMRGASGLTFVLLAALLVGWPYCRRIAADVSNPMPSAAEAVPAAAVFLFDNSLSMQYTQQNATRLDAAKRIGLSHLERLPTGSRVAVMSTGKPTSVPLLGDLSAVGQRIEALRIEDAAGSLDQAIEQAIRMQQRDRQQALDEGGNELMREVYVFTDMCRSAWGSRARRLQSMLSDNEWLQVYLIDVGVEQPENIGINRVRLSHQVLPAAAELVLDAELLATGAEAGGRMIEIEWNAAEAADAGGSDRRVVDIEGSTRANAQFFLRNLPTGLVQGSIRIRGSDPLEADDEAWFTVHVTAAPRILIVAENDAEARLWKNALAPAELVRLNRAPYLCEVMRPGRLLEASLRDFDVVCLISPRRLPAAAWTRLQEAVNQGLGLFLSLGHEAIDITAYDQPEARELVPVELRGAIRFASPQQLDPVDAGSHPLFATFEDLGGTGELVLADVRRIWSVVADPDARTLMRYTDRRQLPALVERATGKGRAMVLTTAVDGREWNDLPLTRWSYVALADLTMQYLTRQVLNDYNYQSGDTVALQLPDKIEQADYVLRKPGFEQVRESIEQGRDTIVLSDLQKRGSYRLTGTGELQGFVSGFSVNLVDGETNLDRLPSDELDQLLGADRYHVARRIEELDRVVRTGRIGLEMYPWLVTLVLVVFALEHLVANRFYEAEERSDSLVAGKG